MNKEAFFPCFSHHFPLNLYVDKTTFIYDLIIKSSYKLLLEYFKFEEESIDRFKNDGCFF